MKKAKVKVIKQKKNNRTLRKKISSVIFLSSFINTLILGGILVFLTFFIFQFMNIAATNYVSMSISKDISMGPFLKKYDLENIETVSDAYLKEGPWINEIKKMSDIRRFFLKELLFESDKDDNNPIIDDFVYLDISIKNKTIYSNISDYQNDIKIKPLSNLLEAFNNEVETPIMDKEMKPMGRVKAFINPYIFYYITITIILFILIMLLGTILISRLMSVIFAIPLINPLIQLEKNIIAVAENDFEALTNSQIVLKKPLREVENLANATNKVMNKMKTYAEQLENQNDELEAQNEELIESRQQIELTQSKIVKSEKAVRVLLDNASQGFLSFGSNLLINNEYSLECQKIFNQKIEQEHFSNLLYPNDIEQQNFINKIFEKLFLSNENINSEMYLSLLPDEILLNEKFIHIAYKIVKVNENSEEKNIMVIITDISDKKDLENQVELERNTLKMVIKVVTNYNDFIECVKDFEYFYETKIFNILRNSQPLKEKLYEIYRNLHNFKGNFSLYGMISLVPYLHKAESTLSELCNNNTTHISIEDLEKCVFDFKMKSWLDEDMQILKDILGEDFFDQENVLTVDKLKLIEIEKKMVSILSPSECKLLLPNIRQLRFKPFCELLRSYTENIQRLSDRLGKLVYPLEIKGGEFLVNTDRYHTFSKSLVHIFRNIVDHGIECPDERIKLKKDEYGTVSCDITLSDDIITINISDDGRGIDIDGIKKKAIEKNIYTPDEIEKLSEEELSLLIFLDDFSTKDAVTELSGRGIGLASVNKEVEKLGGLIEVYSKHSEGTKFTIKIPLSDSCDIPQISTSYILEPLAEVTKRIFNEQLGIDLKCDEEFFIEKSEKLQLKKITSFINVKGIVEGMYIMSVDEKLCEAMVRSFVMGEVNESEIAELCEDTLAECTNIILGNSIKLLPEFEDLLLIETPITISTEGASVKYAESEIWTCKMDSESGIASISFVIFGKTM